MVKQATTLEEQVALLRARGLLLDEEQALREALTYRGYYRLSGYWRYFQIAPGEGVNSFREGVTASAILEVVDFDDALRSLLLDGLGSVELGLKALLGDAWALESSPVGYLRPTELSGPKPDETLERVQDSLRVSREEAVRYHLDNQMDVPIWTAMAALSFGTTSKLYKSCGLTRVKQHVASRLGLRDVKIAGSALEGLAILRNVCAHRHRLWNRTGLVAISLPASWKGNSSKRIYVRTPWALIICLRGVIEALGTRADYVHQLDEFLDRHSSLLSGLQAPRSTGRGRSQL